VGEWPGFMERGLRRREDLGRKKKFSGLRCLGGIEVSWQDFDERRLRKRGGRGSGPRLHCECAEGSTGHSRSMIKGRPHRKHRKVGTELGEQLVYA